MVDQYLQALKALSKECVNTAVDTNTYGNKSFRDAFINVLSSPHIQQRV